MARRPDRRSFGHGPFVLGASLRAGGAGWPFDLPAVEALESLRFDRPVTFLVGENGSGKSTLIEALAGAYGLNVEGGSRSVRHRTRETESPLGGLLRVVRTPGRRANAYFLRAETAHGLYTYLQDDVGDSGSFHESSHGEGFLERWRAYEP